MITLQFFFGNFSLRFCAVAKLTWLMSEIKPINVLNLEILAEIAIISQ